jgi:DNA repair photolyase
MVENTPDFLFLQTRSSLVQRDVDLLQKLEEKVRISITIETDSEYIRKHFSPSAPPINARLKIPRLLKEGGSIKERN